MCLDLEYAGTPRQSENTAGGCGAEPFTAVVGLNECMLPAAIPAGRRKTAISMPIPGPVAAAGPIREDEDRATFVGHMCDVTTMPGQRWFAAARTKHPSAGHLAASAVC